MTASAADVADLCRELERRGIAVWLDGGWGVDALLGRETRTHGDVDIVVEERNLGVMREHLERRGFSDAPQPDTRPWNFVLANAAGLKVDVHVIVFDADGNGIYGPRENGQFFPAAAFGAEGVIDGLAVKCLSPEYQIANRTGYRLWDSDRHDVRALAEAFCLPLPEIFAAEEGSR